MSKNTGGPAFPVISSKHLPGMTLRDYFAAKAMQAILTNTDFIVNMKTDSDLTNTERIALFSYQAADAMLKARES